MGRIYQSVDKSNAKIFNSRIKSLVFQNIAKHSGGVENRGPRLHAAIAAIERITRQLTQLERFPVSHPKIETRFNCEK